MLDCDEVITGLDMETISDMIDRHPEGVGRLLIDNHYISNQTDMVYQDRLGRLFNRRFFHFESPIHEQITHNTKGMGYESYDMPLSIDHVGYLSVTDLRSKVERNNTLLFKELEKHPDDPYLYFQIGQSYNMIYDYENAYIYYGKALEYDVNPDEEWVQMMMIAYANALLHTDRKEEAPPLEGVYDAFATTADFFCRMGQIYMANGQYVKALMEFVKAIHCPIARESGTNTFIPTYNVGLINEMMGNKEEALVHYKNCGDFPMAVAKLKELGLSER